MKFEFDKGDSTFLIASYSATWVRIGDARYESPCVVTPSAIYPELLPARIDDLALRHFEMLVGLAPQIVLLGTGERQRFVDFSYQALLASHGIGLEVMTTGAACRSYNVLVGEHRSVIAALFLQ
jgi:uncharacterized protein